MTNYEITKEYFAKLNINDEIFDTMRNTYRNYKEWFKKMQNTNQVAFVIKENNKIIGIFAVKVEVIQESDVYPIMPARAYMTLKIRTLRSIKENVGVGTALLNEIKKIAKAISVNIVYITFFDKQDFTERMIKFLEKRGFTVHGIKENGKIEKEGRDYDELVYVAELPY